MSQFVEMFDFHELNLNAPSNDFEDLCYDDTSSATKIPACEYLPSGKFAIYDQSQDNVVAGYTDEEQGLCKNYPAVLVRELKGVLGELRKDAAEIDSIKLPDQSVETKIEDEIIENPE